LLLFLSLKAFFRRPSTTSLEPVGYLVDDGVRTDDQPLDGRLRVSAGNQAAFGSVKKS
jgi:hypothetical protein